MTHIADIAADPPFDPCRDPIADWGRSLPRAAFQEILFVLRGALPPPVLDGPEAAARRDRAALAGVASLRPVNAAEGRLAAQFVAADAWAMDCLRLAQEKRLEPGVAVKCRAQAMSLMREAGRALRALQQMQAARRTMDAAAAELAGWEEHAAARMMREAADAVPGWDGAVAGAGDSAGDSGGYNVPEGSGEAPATPARSAAGPRGTAREFGFVPETGTYAGYSRSETNARFLFAWPAEGGAHAGMR